MTPLNYPSPVTSYRRADLVVHVFGLGLILIAGCLLVSRAVGMLSGGLVVAVVIYVLCALASNVASILYHFTPWHGHRKVLRRIDHAAIYPSISGTFTPFFVLAGTTWTLTLLMVCWALTLVAIWNKITNETIQSRWSTASYLGLGALGLSALPDLGDVPVAVLWWVIAGAGCYVIGVVFYARRSMPYRYAIWHTWVNLGGIMMFVGLWIALF